jgi:glutaminyl-peptide cyclotransferase
VRNCLSLALGLAVVVLPGTVGAAVPAFDGRESQRWIERQCALGPRVPGTKAHQRWIEMVTTYFDSLGVPVRREEFRRPSPLGGDSLRLSNLIASVRPGVRPRLLLGAHWDSRPWADEDPDPAMRQLPVPGANDGASGVAVLLVLARMMRESPPPLGVDLAFFDMEDMGRPERPEAYCEGSRYMATHWPGTPPDWVVVLDMVGSEAAEFGREAYSVQQAPELVDLLFRLAAEKGYREWNSESVYAVVDDHLSFQAVGVPAVDVIGFNDPNWHTRRDDPRRTSALRLFRVGSVLAELTWGGHLGR